MRGSGPAPTAAAPVPRPPRGHIINIASSPDAGAGRGRLLGVQARSAGAFQHRRRPAAGEEHRHLLRCRTASGPRCCTTNSRIHRRCHFRCCSAGTRAVGVLDKPRPCWRSHQARGDRTARCSVPRDSPPGFRCSPRRGDGCRRRCRSRSVTAGEPDLRQHTASPRVSRPPPPHADPRWFRRGGGGLVRRTVHSPSGRRTGGGPWWQGISAQQSVNGSSATSPTRHSRTLTERSASSIASTAASTSTRPPVSELGARAADQPGPRRRADRRAQPPSSASATRQLPGLTGGSAIAWRDVGDEPVRPRGWARRR